MKHVTTWSPDTCNCSVSYEWDDEQNEDERVHTGVTTEHTKQCEYHKFGIAHNHFLAVHEENSRKNRTLGFIADTHNVKHEDISWQFDNDRHLHVDTGKLALTNQHKKTAQDWANVNLGTGKVTIK